MRGTSRRTGKALSDLLWRDSDRMLDCKIKSDIKDLDQWIETIRGADDSDDWRT
ncbi:UNVERIFIED_ORG: hypothetical protein M2435_002883 [Rhizobium sophorae]|jgi:hypothetical protein|nr:hypothetical protein [Rhizobium leguminosarum]MDH6659973.1 hypothetical protein [Rhizobium sophorae]